MDERSIMAAARLLLPELTGREEVEKKTERGKERYIHSQRKAKKLARASGEKLGVKSIR